MDPTAVGPIVQGGVAVVALAILAGFYKALKEGVLVLGGSVEAEREVWRGRIDEGAQRIANLEEANRLLAQSSTDQQLPALRESLAVAAQSVEVLQALAEQLEQFTHAAGRTE